MTATSYIDLCLQQAPLDDDQRIGLQGRYDFVQLNQDLDDIENGKPPRHGDRWQTARVGPYPGRRGDSLNKGWLYFAIADRLLTGGLREGVRQDIAKSLEAWENPNQEPWHYGEIGSKVEYQAATFRSMCSIWNNTRGSRLEDALLRGAIERHLYFWLLRATSTVEKKADGETVVTGLCDRGDCGRWEPWRRRDNAMNVLANIACGHSSAVSTLLLGLRDSKTVAEVGRRLNLRALDPLHAPDLRLLAAGLGDIRSQYQMEVWRWKNGDVVTFHRGAVGSWSTPPCLAAAIIGGLIFEFWPYAVDGQGNPIKVRTGSGGSCSADHVDGKLTLTLTDSDGIARVIKSFHARLEDLAWIQSTHPDQPPKWWGPVADAAGLTGGTVEPEPEPNGTSIDFLERVAENLEDEARKVRDEIARRAGL